MFYANVQGMRTKYCRRDFQFKMWIIYELVAYWAEFILISEQLSARRLTFMEMFMIEIDFDINLEIRHCK
jgi:hypothetical protein